MNRFRVLAVSLVVVALSAASLAAVLLAYHPGDSISTSCEPGSCSPNSGTSTATTTTTTTVFDTPPTSRTTATVTTEASTTVTTTTTFTCCTAAAERLGFWLQEHDVMKVYSPSTFFDTMFMTPPYPSSMEMMVFSILQDQANSNGCSATSPFVNSSLSYWGQVAQLADSHPKIRLMFEIAFNATSSTFGLSCFSTVVQALSVHPSVYGIGVEGEYTSGKTPSTYSAAMGYVTAAGKYFINYYAPNGYIPSGGFGIVHTNFPAQGDQVATLSLADSQTVGLSSGYYDSFPFPSNFTCPIGPNAVATGALTNEPQGFNQCVISTELAVAASFSPESARQFLELAPGFSSSGSFRGVSGLTTNQLWDNPTLRNWVWTDPSYQTSFILAP